MELIQGKAATISRLPQTTQTGQSNPVRQRFKVLVVLFAWFLATGAPWDLAQTFGWGRMIVEYARTMPLDEAVKRTFGGEMCGVCEIVNDAKQSDDGTLPRLGSFDQKLLILVAPPALVVNAPAVEPWPRRQTELPLIARAAPPVPPPRA